MRIVLTITFLLAILLAGCGSGDPGAPPITQQPLGAEITQVDVGPQIQYYNADGEPVPESTDPDATRMQINAQLGIDSCNIDADDNDDRCERSELLCSPSCNDCNLGEATQYSEYSCVTLWVEAQTDSTTATFTDANGDNPYLGLSSYCVLDSGHIDTALASCSCDSSVSCETPSETNSDSPTENDDPPAEEEQPTETAFCDQPQNTYDPDCRDPPAEEEQPTETAFCDQPQNTYDPDCR